MQHHPVGRIAGPSPGSSVGWVTVATSPGQTAPLAVATRTPAIRAVCMDIDDTLVDYGTSMRAGLLELLGADDEWSDWCATTERHYPRYTAGEIDFDTMRRQRTKDFFAGRGEFLDDSEVVEREDRRMAAMRRAWRLFDDAMPCLCRLRRDGLLLAAITNAAGEHQRIKLRALGLDAVFDAVLISGELGTAKPDPVIFRTACAVLGVHPSSAVHVGDRLDLDVEGARAAGLHGVWLRRSYRSDLPKPSDITVITGLDELPGVIAGADNGLL